jgi:hypothetical protein
MAYKLFTSEVLTSADTNTYLANSMATFVNQTDITAGASSVVVSNCFTSAYDRYKIIIQTNVNTGGGAQGLAFTPNVTNSGNYSSLMYQTATSGTVLGFNSTNQTYFVVGFGGINQIMVEIDDYNPRYGTGSTGVCRWASYDNSNSTGGTGSMWSITSGTNTGFTFASGGGYTMGAGTCRVYGYRKV